MNFLLAAQTNLVDEADQLLTQLPETEFMGISLWRYALALGVLILGFALKKVLEVVVVRRLVRLFSKTSFKYDERIVEALGKPAGAFVIVGCVYLATVFIAGGLYLSDPVNALIRKSYLVAVGFIAVWAGYRLVDVFAQYLDDIASKDDDSVKGQFVPVIKQSLRLFTLIIGGLTILSSLDVDIKALLGGLGIGGIAIALAAQDAVGNFIGTLSIFTDRPFKVGDWIIVGDKVDGNVEQIGFRSTKVRTWPKTLMSIPNKVLATEIIDNWSRMPKRRVKMTVGVTYSTTADQMEELLRRIRQLLRDDAGVDSSFFLVRFTDFGASSLDIFLYYFTQSTQWDEHLGVRERVNLNLMRIIRDMGLSIAFPTRSIHVESVPPELAAPKK
ncbi:MAG: mechanosensitive ion channel family protein [Verrucomicrobia bacterium]|jgi:MscS family membrane protein|nr:mechanosensitive ion channel family protein [Verrucomicrobiota bacterium]